MLLMTLYMTYDSAAIMGGPELLQFPRSIRPGPPLRCARNDRWRDTRRVSSSGESEKVQLCCVWSGYHCPIRGRNIYFCSVMHFLPEALASAGVLGIVVLQCRGGDVVFLKSRGDAGTCSSTGTGKAAAEIWWVCTYG